MRTLERIDSSYPLEKILPFCRDAIDDARPGAENMSPEEWGKKPHTFLYLLYIEKRFDGPKSGYIICKENDKIICGQGFYLSEIDNMVCCGVRSYTILGENCVNTHGDIKDMVFDIAKEAGARGCFFSFNEYNKRYVDGYIKINDPHNFSTSYQDEQGQWWSKQGRKIHPFSAYGPILLKGTKQWIIYHLWDQTQEQQLLEELRKMDYETC